MDPFEGDGKHVGGEVDTGDVKTELGGCLSRPAADADADVEHRLPEAKVVEALQNPQVLGCSPGADEVLAKDPLVGEDAGVRVLRFVEEVAEGQLRMDTFALHSPSLCRLSVARTTSF